MAEERTQQNEESTFVLTLDNSEPQKINGLAQHIKAHMRTIPEKIKGKTSIRYLNNGHRSAQGVIITTCLTEEAIEKWVSEGFSGSRVNIEKLQPENALPAEIIKLRRKLDYQGEHINDLTEKLAAANDYIAKTNEEKNDLKTTAEKPNEQAYTLIETIAIAIGAELPEKSILTNDEKFKAYIDRILETAADLEELKSDSKRNEAVIEQKEAKILELNRNVEKENIKTKNLEENIESLKRQLTELDKYKQNIEITKDQQDIINRKHNELQNLNKKLSEIKEQLNVYKRILGDKSEEELVKLKVKIKKAYELEELIPTLKDRIKRLEIGGMMNHNYLEQTVNALTLKLKESVTENRIYKEENEKLKNNLEEISKLSNEEELVEAFRNLYGKDLDKAIELYNEKFSEGIPEKLDIALTKVEDYVFEKLKKDLADIGILREENIDLEKLLKMLSAYNMEFNETEYAKENEKLYNLAKLSEASINIKKEKDLTEMEREAKEIIADYQRVRHDYHMKKQAAESLETEVKKLVLEHTDALVSTEEFRKNNLPLNALFGCYAYSFEDNNKYILRFLIPTNEKNYTEQAALDFSLALASSFKGRKAEIKTGIIRNCHHIDLVYNSEIGDRVERIVEVTRMEVEKSDLAKIGAKMEIRYIGEISENARK